MVITYIYSHTGKNIHLTTTICPKLSGIPDACAIKIAATASYNAVPSMLIVAPTGRTSLEKNIDILINMGSMECSLVRYSIYIYLTTRLSTLLLVSKHFIVTGSVAELEAVAKAVNKA